MLTGSLRSPLPIRLRRTSSASGGRINRSMLSCRDMAPLLSIHSAPSKRGKGGGASHQRGNAFPTPAGRLYGFRRQRRYKKWRRRRRTSPAQRYYIPPEGGALNPSGRRQPVPDRTLGAQGRKARRRHQPSPAGRQPSGIQVSAVSSTKAHHLQCRTQQKSTNHHS